MHGYNATLLTPRTNPQESEAWSESHIRVARRRSPAASRTLRLR